MSDKNSTLKKYEGHWAAVYIESGFIRDVTYAKGIQMAKTLLLSNYSDQLKKLVVVKPVSVTVLKLTDDK